MIVKSALGVSIAVILFSLSQFVKEFVLAWQFGAGEAVDLLGLASAVHLVVFGILSPGIEAAYVPLAMELSSQGRQKTIATARGVLLLMPTIAVVASILVVPVSLPIFHRWGPPQQTAEELRDFKCLLMVLGVWTSFQVWFFTLRAVFRLGEGLLRARGRAAVAELWHDRGHRPLARPARDPLRLGRHGRRCCAPVRSLAAGPAARAAAAWSRRLAGRGGILLAALPYTAALLLPSFNVLVDRGIAVHLGTGSVAALGYAERILYLPVQALIIRCFRCCFRT